MIIKRWAYGILTLLVLWWAWPLIAADDAGVPTTEGLQLTRAVMCEYIETYEPRYAAVTFPIGLGRISCFTSFEGISKSTHAYHKWYRRDALVTTKRLTLKPPSWSTYSSIQLRDGDISPWRVEIFDANNQLIKILRFSITE